MSIPLEVTRLSASTIQLRQPKAAHWEAPFLFLLFGSERALLLDTGATADTERLPLRETVDDLIAEWLRSHPRADYGLVVAHTHAHGDHIAGDAQFDGRPSTSVVGTTVDDVIAFFGLRDWPGHPVVLSLGDRDDRRDPRPRTRTIGGRLLRPRDRDALHRRHGLPGSSVHPGPRRVPRDDRPTRSRSATRATRPCRCVRGCHVEMSTTPGVDYPVGTVDQPDEVPLDLPPQILDEVRRALDDEIGPSRKVVRDQFILSYED